MPVPVTHGLIVEKDQFLQREVKPDHWKRDTLGKTSAERNGNPGQSRRLLA